MKKPLKECYTRKHSFKGKESKLEKQKRQKEKVTRWKPGSTHRK